MATIAASRLEEQTEALYTFGSPRVGNKKWCKSLERMLIMKGQEDSNAMAVAIRQFNGSSGTYLVDYIIYVCEWHIQRESMKCPCSQDRRHSRLHL